MTSLRDALWNYPDRFIETALKVKFATTLFSAFIIVLIVLVSVFSIIRSFVGQKMYNRVYKEAVLGTHMGFNPLLFTSDQVESDITYLVYEPLIRIDSKGKTQPVLASTWNVSYDGKEYVIYLRDDKKWHDDYPFSANDVLTTYTILKASGDSTEAGRAMKDVTITIKDDYTVSFVLPQANASFIELLTIGIIPDHIFRGYSYPKLIDTAEELKPVGTGNYTYVRKTSNTHVLKANKPVLYENGINEIHFIEYNSYSAAVSALKKGDVDGMVGLSQDARKYFDEIPEYNSEAYPLSNSVRTLFFNTKSTSAIKELVVRKAVAQALEKAEILEAGEGAKIANGPYGEESIYYNNAIEQDNIYNPDEANKLLEDAGYILDGAVRKKGDLTLSFTLKFYDTPINWKVCESIKSQLTEIGVELKLSAETDTKLFEQIIPGRDFEILFFEIRTGVDPDQYSLWHSAQVEHPGLNLSQYATQGLDGALERGRLTQNQDNRKEAYFALQKELSQDVPVIFLYHSEFSFVYSSTLVVPENKEIISSSDRFSSVLLWRKEPGWRNRQTR